MDVIIAILNGMVSKNIYIEILEGFEGHGDSTKVVKLKWTQTSPKGLV